MPNELTPSLGGCFLASHKVAGLVGLSIHWNRIGKQDLRLYRFVFRVLSPRLVGSWVWQSATLIGMRNPKRVGSPGEKG